MAMNDPRMTDNRALVSIEQQQHPSALIPGKSEYSLMHEMAGSLVKTGFLPKGVDTPEKALAIMLKGRELNIPPMQALANIAVINGKPTVQAELMLALIYRAYGKKAIRVKESTDERCTVEYRLDGWNDVQSYSFTIEQAKKAGLVKPGPWQSYPAAMLRARCISAVARMAFPECIAGMYVPGELGDDVQVTDDGEVVSAPPMVDQDTGEIVDTPGRAVAKEVGVIDQREPIRATAEIVDEPKPIGTWEDENRRLHAIGSKFDLDHNKLKVWLIAAALRNKNQSREITSTRDVSPAALRFLADRIEKDNGETVRKEALEAYADPKVYELWEQGEAEKALGSQAELDMYEPEAE